VERMVGLDGKDTSGSMLGPSIIVKVQIADIGIIETSRQTLRHSYNKDCEPVYPIHMHSLYSETMNEST